MNIGKNKRKRHTSEQFLRGYDKIRGATEHPKVSFKALADLPRNQAHVGYMFADSQLPDRPKKRLPY
jgi:hypothetical protein